MYTTKDAYSIITEGVVTRVRVDKELAAVWSNLINQKVSVLFAVKRKVLLTFSSNIG